MPIPVPSPSTPQRLPAPQVPVHHLPDVQNWAVQQEQQRHDQALYARGEYAVFVLMWHVIDFKAGRVERCSRCYASANALVASVYEQATEAKCPACFGTTYEGGYKAILVRPSLWDSNEEDYRSSPRGEIAVQTVSVQSTSDFRMRTGDYIFRADGSRYQMRTMSSNELRTGFGLPGQGSVVGYNYGTVNREDESSVAYLLPPSQEVIEARLLVANPRMPQDFSDIEVVRGPVLA